MFYWVRAQIITWTLQNQRTIGSFAYNKNTSTEHIRQICKRNLAWWSNPFTSTSSKQMFSAAAPQNKTKRLFSPWCLKIALKPIFRTQNYFLHHCRTTIKNRGDEFFVAINITKEMNHFKRWSLILSTILDREKRNSFPRNT